MPGKVTTIDAYLAKVKPDQRTALEKLRSQIKAAAPKAEECTSYQLPAFRLDGRLLVAFGAAKNHCAFYPASYPIESLKDELKKYDTSKGTIRFAADKPLPAALVRMIVKARILQNEIKQAKSSETKAANRTRDSKSKAESKQSDPGVVAFLAKLKHPLKKEIESVRQIILGASPQIREGIKWNSPSFRTTEYFATLNLRQDRVWLILHTGAKPKKAEPLKITDPKKLIQWLGKDRCLVTFDNAKDVAAKRKPLEAIIRKWIKYLPGV